MASSGTFDQILPESILGQLNRKRFTGRLLFRRGRIEKEYVWERGIIVFSRSNDPHDYLGQYLISQGTITEDDLHTALQTQAETNVMLGRIFIMVGIITEEDMEIVLAEKTAESIYDILLWSEGEWSVFPKAAPPDGIVYIRLETDGLVKEGLRRRAIWKKIKKAIPARTSKFKLLRGKIPEDAMTDFDLQNYFDLVDEGRSLAEIAMETRRSDFHIGEIFYRMIAKGYLLAAEPNEQGVSQPAKPASPLDKLLAEGEKALMAGRYGHALSLYKEAMKQAPTNEEARLGLTRTRKEYVEHASQEIPMTGVPKLKISLKEMMKLNLSPEEGYILSRIDGNWNIKAIVNVSPLDDTDAILIFKRLLDEGLIEIK